jgi:hypothetical protein
MSDLKLTGLDDTLFHQSADPMAYTNVSDHRFFDRSVYGIYAPDHSVHICTSIGVYKNMDVMDGFVMAQVNREKQHNQRYSRRLSLDYERPGLGPLQYDVIEPMKRHRVSLAKGEHPVSFEIEWTAVLPAHLEARHEVRHHGRLIRNYSRFDQFAKANGWIDIEGQSFEVKDWFSWRDHAWGVRPGVGGYEPDTGGLDTADGYLAIYFWFLTEDAGGFIQLQENGEGEVRYLNGVVQSRHGEPDRKVTKVEHEIEFEPGTRVFRRMQVRFTTEDGKEWHGEAEPLGRGWVFKGSGYNGGYNDERGLGFFRGEQLEEIDVYGITHPEDVVFPDGSISRPLHREQFSRVVVDGKPGQAHTVVQSTGEHRRYGLGGDAGQLPV